MKTLSDYSLQVVVTGIVKSQSSEGKAGRGGKRAQAKSLYVLYIEANNMMNCSKVVIHSPLFTLLVLIFDCEGGANKQQSRDRYHRIHDTGNVFNNMIY